VFFTGGQVTGRLADGSRQPLARRLIGAGAVDDAALAAAVRAAPGAESVGVVKALLEQGAIEGGLLRQAVTDQSVDAVFDLLRWQQGDFAFVVEEVNPDDVGVALSIESHPGRRRVSRRQLGKRLDVVPSANALLSMPVVLPTDPQISREEWSLLALVRRPAQRGRARRPDGQRALRRGVDTGGNGHPWPARGARRDRPDDDHVGVVVRRQGLLAALEVRRSSRQELGAQARRRPSA
jgi:hypothetical protein